MIINPYNYGNIKKTVGPSLEQIEKLNNSNNEKEETKELKKVNSTLNKSSSDKYFEQKILSAKPQDLVTMLYDGLVRFIKQAIITLEMKDFAKVNENAIRAQAIVAELRATLDMDVETSENMDRLYIFIFDNLQEGNLKKDSKKFEDALKISQSMAEMWRELLKQL